MKKTQTLDPVLAASLASLWMYDDVRAMVDTFVSEALSRERAQLAAAIARAERAEAERDYERDYRKSEVDRMTKEVADLAETRALLERLLEVAEAFAYDEDMSREEESRLCAVFGEVRAALKKGGSDG